MITLREITQDLFYEKTRTILTIIAIAWGTFSIAITLAVGEGLRLNFARTLANAGDRLLMVYPGVTSKNYRGIGVNEPLKLTKKDFKSIVALPNINGATIQYNFETKLRYRGHETREAFRAVSPAYAVTHYIKVGVRQRFISTLDGQNRSSVIVIGANVAKELFPNEDMIGKTVYIDNHPFKVVGIMQPKPQLTGSDIPDEWLNFIPFTTYELLHGPESVDLIAVAYKDFKALPQIKANIQKVVAFNHNVDPTDVSIVNFSDIAEQQEEINNFFINMQIFLGVVGGLALLLAGVGIANVMYAAVRRSTHQIGIRMALGATTKNILSHYIFGSLIATIVGGIIGIIMATVLVYVVSLIPLTGELIQFTGKPKPVLSFLVLIIVVIVLGIVGFLAGLFPALKATKIDPAEALIYE